MFSKQILNIKFEITSPETMLSWSYGEVRNGNSFDDDGKPVIDGLFFCSQIFRSKNKTECLYKTPTLTQSFGCMVCGMYLDKNKLK